MQLHLLIRYGTLIHNVSSSSLSIRASVAVAMLFIPSSHVLSSYFLCFTQFGGGQHCFNFDKFHDTAPLQKKKEKKKERKKEKENLV